MVAKKMRPRTALNRAVEKVGGPQRAADICGVRYQSINNWQNWGYIPNLAKAAKLAKAAGVPLEKLVTVES